MNEDSSPTISSCAQSTIEECLLKSPFYLQMRSMHHTKLSIHCYVIIVNVFNEIHRSEDIVLTH